MFPQAAVLKSILFSFYAMQAVLLPYLPNYFETQGYTAVQIGWMMNIGPFMAMFAQPVWGMISDRYRTLKRIIGLLWILTFAASVGLFTSHSYAAAMTFVLLLYFFMYPSVPLLDSFTMKTIQGTGRSYGSIRMWGSVGFCTVALTSGYVLAAIGGIDRIGPLFWVLSMLPIGLLLLLREHRTEVSPKQERARIRSILNGRLLWFLTLVLLVSIPHRMNDVLFTLHLKDLGAPDAWYGWAWFVAALSEIPVFALLGRYMYRFHELALIGLTAVLYTVRWLVYAVVDDPLTLIALQGTHSVTFAVFWVAVIQYIVRLIPEELGSTGQAFISSVFLGLAGLVGGMAGGWFKDMWGGASMYVFGAVMCMVSAVLLYATHAAWKRKGCL